MTNWPTAPSPGYSSDNGASKKSLSEFLEKVHGYVPSSSMGEGWDGGGARCSNINRGRHTRRNKTGAKKFFAPLLLNPVMSHALGEWLV